MRTQLLAKTDPGITGTSRYVRDLFRGLREAGVDARLTFPQSPPVPGLLVRGLKRLGPDLQAFSASHPLRARLDHADLYHITTQTMATLLWTQRFPAPTAVSVLDLIPYLVRGDPELDTSRHAVDRLFYRLALSGLRRADALIAISQYTKRTLIEALGLPEERIHVVYPAVDHERFRPLHVPSQFRVRYGLDEGHRFVLYVGSDDPRKNLQTLLRAFAPLRQRVGRVKLLLVGQQQFLHHHKQLLTLVAELELGEDVLCFDGVPERDLPFFYNAAAVFVFPSLYEGFGLPVAEAMACGTPVVCSNRTSLPEVVGDGGLLVDPDSVVGLEGTLAEVVEDEVLAESLRKQGLERSATFTLERAASEIVEVYTTACA